MHWRDIDIHVVGQFQRVSPVTGVQSLGSAGGFSGARFWRLRTDSGPLCLRAWPPELRAAGRLQWIHAVQRHLCERGCREIPSLRLTPAGHSFVPWNQRFWELSCWMPGQADYWQQPSGTKLTAAMQTLARLHLASCSFSRADPCSGLSSAVQERRRMIHQTNCDILPRLLAAIPAGAVSQLARLASEILHFYQQAQSRVASQLEAVQLRSLPLQVVIRDIWHDHLLFSGDQVTGVVDFGTVGVDAVSLDVARLLGSLVGDDPDQRRLGLEAYQTLRPLTNDEEHLVPIFDASTVLLSGINWLRWLFLESRQFESMETVQNRLTGIKNRLEQLSGEVGSCCGEKTPGLRRQFPRR